MYIINASRQQVLAYEGKYAKTFKARLKGLMGTKSFPPGAALVIHPCSSIHTCFMKYPIDVLFLDKNNRVISVIENLPPFRLSKIIKGSRTVVELPPGTIKHLETRQGDFIEFKQLRGEKIETKAR